MPKQCYVFHTDTLTNRSAFHFAQNDNINFILGKKYHFVKL